MQDRRAWSFIGTLVILCTVRAVDGQVLGVDTCFGNTALCDAIDNAVCDTTATYTCVCSAGYNDDGSGTNCIANVLGDACGSDVACSGIPDAVCAPSATCVCISGYKDDGTGTSCIPNELGDTCFVTPQCLAIANAVCEGGPPGVCACDTGFVDNAGGCDQIVCPALTTPTDGAVDMTGGLNFGNEAFFSCNTGYDPDAPVTATCEGVGTWDIITHTCTIKDCGALTQPTDGVATLDDGSTTTYLATATFTCNLGYTPDNPVTSTCQADGNWDVTVHTCTIKDCGALVNPTNGIVDTSGGTIYGSTASFACEAGYEPLTPVTATCQADATWDITTLACTARDCGDPTPANGASGGPTTFPNSATIACDNGYDLSGSSSIDCLDTGAWSETPTCDAKDCGDPSPTNGAASGTYTYPGTATISCNAGYNIPSPTSISCLDTGDWSAIPTCDPVDCGDPSLPNGGHTGTTTYPNSVTVSCDSGYELSGSATLTCETTGDWDGTPVCNPVDCGDPAPNFGSSSGSFTFPNSATVSCDPGYDLVGSSSVSCQDNGQWSSTPTCDPVDCGNPQPTNGQSSGLTTYPNTATITCDSGYDLTGFPSGTTTVTCQTTGVWDSVPVCNPKDCGNPAILNGFFSAPLGTTYTQEATLSCNSGYELAGDATLTCQATGSWSGSYSCNPVACPSLSNPTKGLVSAPLVTYQEVATYSCNTGYNLVGDPTRSCQADKTWSGNEPACQIQVCPGLNAPANGQVNGFTTQGEYLDIATYSCNVGHTLNGAPTTQCQADGTWSQPAPSCDIVDCGTLPGPADGVVDISLGTTYNQQAQYSCNLGFVRNGVSARNCLATGSWDGVAPTCTLADCGAPGSITDGSVTYSAGTTYNQQATYTCILGYQLTGMAVRVCLNDETWSDSVPTCTIKDCGSLATPAGGAVNTDAGTTYLKVATFSCNTGYAPDSAVLTTCEDNGQWSVATHTCIMKDCGPLNDPPNGALVLISGLTTYDSTATFSCNTGYAPDDPETAKCLSTGNWDIITKTCTIKDCGFLQNPVDGYVETGDGTTYSELAVYTCITGYELNGISPRTCQADEQWSGNAPTCTIVSCPTLVVPDHGDLTRVNGQYQDTVTYSCETGYDLVGVTVRTCLAASLWSDTDPICDPRDCGDLADPADGFANWPGGTTFSQVAIYTCITGYEPLGGTTSTCQADMTWSFADPECTIKDCGEPSAPTNGRVDYLFGTKYGAEATYSCFNGYDLIGVSAAQCRADASWSEVVICRLKDCQNLDDPPNGKALTPGGTTYGEVGQYSCNNGYVLLGDSTTTCQADGTWGPEDPLCNIQDCILPTTPDNGGVDVTSGTNFKDVATFYCDDGYDLFGDKTTTCRSDATWSQLTEPVCIIRDCGTLGDPPNGGADTPDGTEYGNVGVYSCNEGYDLKGISTTVCQADSSWSPTDPVCSIKSCGSPTPLNNGQVDITGGTNFMDTATFSCDEGYILVGVSSTSCLSDATWSAVVTPPSCDIKDCGVPQSPFHGDVDYGQGTEYGDVALFSCDVGYTISGVQETECMSTGDWDGAMAVCTVKDCGALLDPTDGSVNLGGGTEYLSVASFECHSGYTLTGETLLTCQSDAQWSGNGPLCIINDCGPLLAPVNGDIVLVGGTTYGASATFTCSDGYDRFHHNTLHCLSNGAWDGSEPDCIIRDCGALQNPDGGTVSHSGGTTFGATAVYSCFAGYNLIGGATRHCLSTPEWSGASSPTCVIKDCLSLFGPANGNVNLDEGTLYGATATFSCEIGYSLEGEVTRQCLETGDWSFATPSCEIKDCNELLSPTNGLVSFPQGTTYEAIATFTCNEGYTLSGFTTRTCQSDATWSNNDPTCLVKSCAVLTNPNGGLVDMTNGLSYGDKAIYSCNTGYNLVGQAEVSCLADKSWSHPPPTCQIKDCGNPPVVENGHLVMRVGTEYQAIVSYYCDENYGRVGNADISCGADGAWTTKPVCLPDCGLPADVLYSDYTLDGGTLSQNIATYVCHNGYRISGSSMVFCQSVGQWTAYPECVVEETAHNSACYINLQCVTQLATCRDDGSGTKRCLCNSQSQEYDSAIDKCQNDCGPLTEPTNGKVANPDSTGEGQIATYSCNVGYALSGQSTRTCFSTGWSGSAPTCAIGCMVPVPPDNGGVNMSEGTAAGSTIYYYCKDGYALDGDSDRICLSDTTWNGREPTCLVECPTLKEISHATLDMSGGNWEGSVATYICDGNYALVGTATRTCEHTGGWTGVSPECIFAVFPDVLIVLAVLFFFLLAIDVFIIAFWIYLKYWRKKKDKDDKDPQEQDQPPGFPAMVETPRDLGPARLSFRKLRNSRVGPGSDYAARQGIKVPLHMPPVPGKAIGLRPDGTPYQTRVPKPKPIHRSRQSYGFRDEAVPFVPLVTAQAPPPVLQQPMPPTGQIPASMSNLPPKPGSGKDGYTTSTSEDSQQRKAPSIAEEDQISLDPNSGVEADEGKEIPKVMHNATTGFEGRMGLPKVKNPPSNPELQMTPEIKTSMKNSVQAYTPNGKRIEPVILKPTDKEGIWFP